MNMNWGAGIPLLGYSPHEDNFHSPVQPMAGAGAFPVVDNEPCSRMMWGIEQSTNITDVLTVTDHCARRLGNANHFSHYFFCGSRHFSLDEPTFFSVSNAPRGLLELANYPRRRSTTQWHLKDPFLSCIPKDQFMPFHWSRRDLHDDSELFEALEKAGIASGVSFVSRGITQDVMCLTLMVSEILRGNPAGGQPDTDTFFALHGMGVHSDLQTPTGLLASKPISGRVFGHIERSCQPARPRPASLGVAADSGLGDAPGLDFQLELRNEKLDNLWKPDDVLGHMTDIRIWSKANLLTATAMDRVRRVIEALGSRPDFPHEEVAILPQLSAQEINVGRHMVAGLMSKVIADRLNCSTANVNYHIRGIYKKLGVRTRGAAVAKLQVLGVGDARTGTHVSKGQGA
jgi:DNA-binding CsgD family transcriptional regulator